jgi:hypothetical protein
MRARTVHVLVLAAMLLALFAVPALAQSEPIAGCPDGFHLHETGEHHDGEGHFHVGTAADQNGDGWICALHVSVDGSIHLHIDNQSQSS